MEALAAAGAQGDLHAQRRLELVHEAFYRPSIKVPDVSPREDLATLGRVLRLGVLSGVALSSASLAACAGGAGRRGYGGAAASQVPLRLRS